MTLEGIMEKMKGKTDEEKIRLLKKSRGELLEEIHGKQQLLDQLDYVLYKIKKE